jgi:RND superfamily putative drug exporter
MRALERLFSSRPARIAIILLWLILGAPGGSFAQRLQDVQKNEGSSFLPGSSESVRELTLAKRFRPVSASPRLPSSVATAG